MNIAVIITIIVTLFLLSLSVWLSSLALLLLLRLVTLMCYSCCVIVVVTALLFLVPISTVLFSVSLS